MKRVPSRLRLLTALILTALLLCQGARADAVGSRVLLDRMGEIRVVNQTRYLLARDPKTQLFAVYDTDGLLLSAHALRDPAYVGYSCFRDSSGSGELNSKALVAAGSDYISGYEYGEIRALNSAWALGWVLKEAGEEAYDFKSGQAFYDIERCDVFRLGEDAGLAAQLPGSAFSAAAAHGEYLSLRDREGQVSVYDRDFAQVALKVSNINEGVYGVVDWAVINRADGRVILDGFSECREISLPEGTLLQIARTDYSGQKQYAVIDLEGRYLLPLGSYSINSVKAGCAVISQNGLQGLYSLSLGRLLVPCEYDSIYANAQALDPYVSYGYACGVKQDTRYYIDVESGEVTRTLVYDAKQMSLVGATSFERLNRTTYTAQSASGRAWRVSDIQLTASRGDGAILVARSFLNNMYGVLTHEGQPALDFRFRFKPVVTDDGRLVIRKYDNTWQLLALE